MGGVQRRDGGRELDERREEKLKSGCKINFEKSLKIIFPMFPQNCYSYSVIKCPSRFSLL